MKPLLSIFTGILLAFTSYAAFADDAPPPRLPPLERPDTLKLRELRLREAVARGEISEDEAQRLRQFYRRHDAIRLYPPHKRQASAPGGDGPPPKDWLRWRRKQDRLNAPPPALPAD